MSSLCLIGSDSLLSNHILSLILSSQSPLQSIPSTIHLWSLSPVNDDNDSIDTPKGISIEHFVGLNRLEEALKNIEIVINCHELIDWTILPNEDQLRLNNIEIPRIICQSIRPYTKLIHISSTFVQTWSRWPNIAGKEQESDSYKEGWPFKAYCRSKDEGEKIILDRIGPSMIVRTVPLYGENDKKSIVTDIIKISAHFNGLIPLIGDNDGCSQMAYAGNVACGVLKAIDKSLWKMEEENSLDRIVIIGDGTPIKNTLDLIYPIIQNGKRYLSTYNIPFFIFYIPYLLLCSILIMISPLINLPLYLQKLPHPSLFYFFFRHWTLFNSFKARLFLDHTDIYSKEETLHRSNLYYKRLHSSDIKHYSWEGSI